MKIIREKTIKRPFADTETTYLIEATYEEIYDKYIDGKEEKDALWFESYYKVKEIEKDKLYEVIMIEPFLD